MSLALPREVQKDRKAGSHLHRRGSGLRLLRLWLRRLLQEQWQEREEELLNTFIISSLRTLSSTTVPLEVMQEWLERLEDVSPTAAREAPAVRPFSQLSAVDAFTKRWNKLECQGMSEDETRRLAG